MLFLSLIKCLSLIQNFRGQESTGFEKILLEKHVGSIELVRDVYSIIINLLRTTEKKYAPSLKQQKIYPAIEYIAKNYNKEIKNDDLASIAGISTVYFRKLFSEIYMTLYAKTNLYF